MTVATNMWLHLQDIKTELASTPILTNFLAGPKPLHQFRYFFTSLQDDLFLPLLFFVFFVEEKLLFIKA